MTKLLFQQFQQVNDLLKNNRFALIASHEDPDPDAIGSVLALNLILKKLNLETFCYLPDPPSDFFNFLPGFFEIKNKIPDNLNPDLLFYLDYADFRRLKLPKFITNQWLSISNIITIDHHRGDQKGEIKAVDTEVSSTCEIIYWWLKDNPPVQISPLSQKRQDWVDKEVANCLLTGIVADTGGFSHVSTSFKTLKAASDLLSKGASLTKIVNRVLSPGPNSLLKSTEIFGKVLSRIKTIPNCGLCYSWVSYQDLKNQSVSSPDLNGIPSIISKEPNCCYALFLTEYEKGKIKGSLRSEPFKSLHFPSQDLAGGGNGGKRKRVNEIAKELGGGGHPYAAGFKQEGTIEEVLKKVIEVIR